MDVVFDPVGKLIPSLKCVHWGARLVVVGFASGPIEKVPANLLLLKSVSIVGLYWGATFGKSFPYPYTIHHIQSRELASQWLTLDHR